MEPCVCEKLNFADPERIGLHTLAGEIYQPEGFITNTDTHAEKHRHATGHK